MGITTRTETEAVVHAVRRALQEHRDNSNYGLLTIGLTNAFDLVSRNASLRGVQDHFPTLPALNTYCFGGEAPYLWKDCFIEQPFLCRETSPSFNVLCNGDREKRPVTGAQQGDPL